MPKISKQMNAAAALKDTNAHLKIRAVVEQWILANFPPLVHEDLYSYKANDLLKMFAAHEPPIVLTIGEGN